MPPPPDAQSFDLVIDLDDGETQREASAACGCTLERTEFSVGFIFCDFHRQAPEPEAPTAARDLTGRSER